MSSHVSDTGRGLGARRAETVARLLEAGAAELAAVGRDALTVRTVATRAGVSPATAYTYLASKNHLFAELFWQHLTRTAPDAPDPALPVLARVRAVTRATAAGLAAAPELAAAVTPALLGSDPDVERLRLRIGAELARRFAVALAPDGEADPDLLEALLLAFSGALLQAGMGLMTYTEMGERLDVVAATILKGHA